VSMAGGLGPSVVPYMYFLLWNRHLELFDTLHTMLCLLYLSPEFHHRAEAIRPPAFKNRWISFPDLVNIVIMRSHLQHIIPCTPRILYTALGCVSSLRWRQHRTLII
jgi:hypothetical protein